LSERRSQRGGASEPIVYGPFRRPWGELWVAIPALLFGIVVSVVFGPEPRLHCERGDDGGGACTLTHLYVLIPIEARTFPVDSVTNVRFSSGRRDAYTSVDLESGEGLRVDWSEAFGREEYERIDRFFADPEQRSFSPRPYPNGRNGFLILFFLVFASVGSWFALRQPSDVVITISGTKATISRRWFGVALSTEEVDLENVTGVGVTKLANAKARFQPWGTKPAGRVVLSSGGSEVATLTKDPVFGDEVHDRVARDLEGRLGLKVVAAVEEDVRAL
jgi:hypothetical protein